MMTRAAGRGGRLKEDAMLNMGEITGLAAAGALVALGFRR